MRGGNISAVGYEDLRDEQFRKRKEQVQRVSIGCDLGIFKEQRDGECDWGVVSKPVKKAVVD